MKRILTGDNTTGKLHLGHYVGSLENRVKLQHQYDTFIILADLHALAYPKYVENPQIVGDSVIDVAVGNLAAGLDPEKVTMFQESEVSQIYELTMIFSMLVTHSRALRNPTIKEEIRDKNLGENYSVGFLNFPIMMAADILCVKADLVPVGEDQLPHLELTNELARKFNTLYGGSALKEIEGLTGRVKRLVGTDGKVKMTKSLGNCIFLDETEEELKRKVMNMYTDPSRIHSTDPGNAEGNPVFIYHDAFNPNKEEVGDLKNRYAAGRVGDVEVKEKLYKTLSVFLSPIREKYQYYENHKDDVVDIIRSGSERTREEASKTLGEVRDQLKLKIL